MPTRARRSNGCWTCKLRRKKCDERPDRCLLCENLGVPCYGYAEKPDWMDAGELEKAKAIEIRAIVKANNDSMRQSRALQALSRRVQGPARKGSPPCPEEEVTATTSPPSLLSSRNEREELDASSSESLFAHYVEHVIPLQFPLYTFPRGGDSQLWLRDFWNQPGPLRSATLSLNMYYQYIGAQQMDEKYDAIISFLESCAKTLSEERRPGTDQMSCLKDIVPLHLSILNVLIDGIRWGDPEPPASPCMAITEGASNNNPQTSHSSSQRTRLYPNVPNQCETALPVLHISSVNNSTLEIFSGVVLWIDILSCASTGLEPQHSELCIAALEGANSKVQLENLMGCENWVMLLIREIATLKAYKRKTSNNPDHHSRELQNRADDIKQRLQAGMGRRGRSYMELTEGKRTPSPTQELTITAVSMIFALSALIYLQVSVHGCAPDALAPVKELMFRWMLNVGFLPDAQPLPNLAWPICIAGCMATTPSQEQFFRGVVASPNVQGRGDKTLRQALEVMEICWERRRAEGKGSLGWDWERAMKEQGRVVLLV